MKENLNYSKLRLTQKFGHDTEIEKELGKLGSPSDTLAAACDDVGRS
jgi:hypothetical protein